MLSNYVSSFLCMLRNKRLFLKLSFLSIATVFMSSNIEALTCPASLTLNCVPTYPKECKDSKYFSSCYISNVDTVWHFVAPQLKHQATFNNKTLSSCSVMPPGQYTALYWISHYGDVPLGEDKSKVAACFYFIESATTLLYTPHYAYDSKHDNWVRLGDRYLCQDAANCHFIPLK